MDPVRSRNKKAEDEFFRMLKRWQEATSEGKIDQYDEQSLKFLWGQLEQAWYAIGYVIGDEGRE